MTIKTLYRYSREDGGVSVSPVKPDCEYIEMYRIIADEGKALTKDGVNVVSCADVETVDGWCEVAEAIDVEDRGFEYIETDNQIESEK